MGGGQWYDDPVFGFLFELTGAARPRVLRISTATGDADRDVIAFYRAFPAHSFEASDLALFQRTVQDLRALVLRQDIVLVAGGNTANMLAVWRVHGLDTILREAWEAGVVMAGGSAGGLCWFQAGTTDSFLMGHADPLHDGLGLVPGSFCPHYDSEPARRPGYHRLVGEGILPAGIACDDLASVHLVGTDVERAITSARGAGAYRVEIGAHGVVEELIDPQLLEPVA
jgi:peptidase E